MLRLLTGVAAATFDVDGIRRSPSKLEPTMLGGRSEAAAQSESAPGADRRAGRSYRWAFAPPWPSTRNASTSRGRTSTSAGGGGADGDDGSADGDCSCCLRF